MSLLSRGTQNIYACCANTQLKASFESATASLTFTHAQKRVQQDRLARMQDLHLTKVAKKVPNLQVTYYSLQTLQPQSKHQNQTHKYKFVCLVLDRTQEQKV